jgi:hypothetical protein
VIGIKLTHRQLDMCQYSSVRRSSKASGWTLRSQGPPESVRNRGDRATALIEGIWCEKIRGCSCSGGGASYSMSAMTR